VRLVDLSHAIHDGLVTYPGLPAPVIRDHLSRADSRKTYAQGTEFQIGRIEMVANTGTYLDAPSHRFEGRPDLSGLALESVANLEGVVVRPGPATGRRIDASALAGQDVRGKAVLVETGWDRHFGTPAYGQGHPFLTRDAAERLRDGGAALVGIDSLNVDDTADGTRSVHTVLLDAGILVVEHLARLSALPAAGFRFFAVPPRVRGMGTFPVRAFALVP
jgi:kynurenine formamidase